MLGDAKIEPAAAADNAMDPVQFERQGYFVRDTDSQPGRPVFNRTVGLRDTSAEVWPAASRLGASQTYFRTHFRLVGCIVRVLGLPQGLAADGGANGADRAGNRSAGRRTPASAAAPVAWLARNLEAEQERWFLWLPVMFGGGIALYFLLPGEPGLLAALLPAVAAMAVRLVAGRGGIAGLLTGALLAASLGVAAGKLRTEAVRAPVLQRQIGPVDVYGFVELVEPRPTQGQRLTLRVTAHGEARGARVAGARARAHHDRGAPTLEPGDAVRLKATLSPPPGPALPGDYDFARAAWFQGLGARRLRHGGAGAGGESRRAAAVAAGERGGRASAAGDRPARGRGAARADRRHRQCAHHRRARRHLGGDQPGVPRLRACSTSSRSPACTW